MTDRDTGGPAFPTRHVDEDKGMTLRQYAAIKLRVPNSGVEWLNDMIRESLRDEFAAKAMQGICANHLTQGQTFEDVAKAAYTQANAMIKAREY